jgi:hypothetical protein
MNIFRKESNDTSNDYYNAYKAELGRVEEKKGFFSLNTIIKMETAIITAGLIFMGYNNFFTDLSKNFSLEFNKNAFISQSILPKSYQFDNSDSELIIQLEESETDTLTPVKIKEERLNIQNNVQMLAKNLDMDFADLSLIVEIIKSEMSPKITSKQEDKIIIGQL